MTVSVAEKCGAHDSLTFFSSSLRPVLSAHSFVLKFTSSGGQKGQQHLQNLLCHLRFFCASPGARPRATPTPGPSAAGRGWGALIGSPVASHLALWVRAASLPRATWIPQREMRVLRKRARCCTSGYALGQGANCVYVVPGRVPRACSHSVKAGNQTNCSRSLLCLSEPESILAWGHLLFLQRAGSLAPVLLNPALPSIDRP